MSYQTNDNSDICKECGGKCCKFILLECNKTDSYKIEFWRAQGNILFYETDYTFVYGQNAQCQHSQEDGTCAIYEDRPLLCREFPKKDLPRLWRSVCPLFHERNKNRNKVLRVFDTQ